MQLVVLSASQKRLHNLKGAINTMVQLSAMYLQTFNKGVSLLAVMEAVLQPEPQMGPTTRRGRGAHRGGGSKSAERAERDKTKRDRIS